MSERVHTGLIVGICRGRWQLHLDDVSYTNGSGILRETEVWYEPKVENVSKTILSSTSSAIPPTKMVFFVFVPSSIGEVLPKVVTRGCVTIMKRQR